MKKTKYGLFAMTLSLVLGFVIALGSLGAMGGKLDSNFLTTQVISVPTVLVSCLDPVTISLEILAILLILWDSRKSDNPQRVLTWIAAGSFVIWAALNLGGFLPLSFIGMQRGSLEIIKAGQLIKTFAALLQYAIPFLLVYGVATAKQQVVLWAALLLSIFGNALVVILSISSITLQATETMGKILSTPLIQIDYTSGIYPLLLTLGYLGGALYLAIYCIMWFQTRQDIRENSLVREAYEQTS